MTSPPGTVIGSIEQEWSIFKPKFGIKNEAGERVLSIEGPFCTFSCGSDVEFHVRNRFPSKPVPYPFGEG